jgi:hypothetical protein
VDIKIKNKKTYQGEGFYIGRPSPLGNPFKVTKYTSREEAINQYENWILRKILQEDKEILEYLHILFANLIRHSQLNLICWCSPKPCHGDIIKKLLEHKYYYGVYTRKGE